MPPNNTSGRRKFDQAIEDRLLALRQEKISQLQGEVHDVVETDELSGASDDQERASEALRDELLDIHVAKIEASNADIAAIDATLQSLRDGTYGKCRDCGAEIEPRRLAVNPVAERCVDCASMYERSSRKQSPT